ncbi:hypothetical protein MMC25_001353 [Agyrium rufum]|nr:hypothetical protein [Agyrium rufum]
MAGMEQLEIHSRSYLVRWVNVKDEHTISWSIQPHKKSINFGIFKHPGASIAPTPRYHSSIFEDPPTPGPKPTDAFPDGSVPISTSSSPSGIVEKLKHMGYKLVSWKGTCEAHQVSSGLYSIPKNEGGMYALVFDNTFAKSFSKTVTFVLLTYPSGNPPISNHQVHHVQGTSLTNSSGANQKTKIKGMQELVHKDSQESIPSHSTQFDGSSFGTGGPLGRQESSGGTSDSSFYTGVLQKRRRKRHQGYARRFFSLDFSTSTLSYYHDRNTLALRGAVPLSLAAIGANGTTREISIDSGAEVWHLKALNKKDFDSWKQALEIAARVREKLNSPATPIGELDGRPPRLQHRMTTVDVDEERDWTSIDFLVSQVSGSRDAVRRLAMDTDPKYMSGGDVTAHSAHSLESVKPVETSSTDGSPNEHGLGDEYFPNGERRAFWKRKPSGGRASPGLFKRSVSAAAAIPPAKGPLINGASSSTTRGRLSTFPEDDVHENCMTILRNLDSVIADFTKLIAQSRQRRSAPLGLGLVSSRISIASQNSEEFFDAEAGDTSQLLQIQQESEDEADSVHGQSTTEHDSASDSDDGACGPYKYIGGVNETGSGFPVKPKNLSPLPLPSVKRRTTVTMPAVLPPSLIGFLRKNVGKDLSSISMPVSANEPTSLLQRVSEQLEYSTLLDQAAKGNTPSVDRLLYVTAFALSALSVIRVKERAIRKPFNPLLGETFELVREDRNFRFMSEKISHRPVRLATQAESDHWCFVQSPLPTQKFWGKSAELITEGRARVFLHMTGDRFSWLNANCFLRNIIAGEKYVEPVGTMTVTNETTREFAVVTFKSKGMFSGRSEDVQVQTFDSYGDELSHGLIGKWTSSLSFTKDNDLKPISPPVWTAGELVPDAPKRYGLTTFAASLNEITANERGHLAPTDSRLRPDQRALDEGDLDTAEELKHSLEEGQRERRKVQEQNGEEYTPQWFSKVDNIEGEEVWMLKSGKCGYWESRSKGDWKASRKIYDV